MADCIFCQIVRREIPAEVVYEDQDILVFKDIHPKAPIHLLFITKQHLASINDLTADNAALVSRIFLRIKEVAGQLGVAENGYKVVANTGAGAGQLVQHLHFHLLAGKQLTNFSV